mgnify:CR=1 FL=1
MLAMTTNILRLTKTTLMMEAASIAIDVHQPAHALYLRVVSRLILIGACLTVAGYGAINDARVYLSHLLIAQSDTPERAWRQVLQNDIAPFGQVQEHLLALGVLQVDGDAFDALSPLQEPGRDVGVGLALGMCALGAGEGSVSPDGVALARYLYLDHLGAHAGQVHGAEWSGKVHGDCQNLYVFQWFHISPVIFPVANSVPD